MRGQHWSISQRLVKEGDTSLAPDVLDGRHV
jgi:hypothetical protein